MNSRSTIRADVFGRYALVLTNKTSGAIIGRTVPGSIPMAPIAHALRRLPPEEPVASRKRGFWSLRAGYAGFPIRRADRDVARVAAEASFEFRIADRYKATVLWNLIEVRDARLSVARWELEEV